MAGHGTELSHSFSLKNATPLSKTTLNEIISLKITLQKIVGDITVAGGVRGFVVTNQEQMVAPIRLGIEGTCAWLH